MLRVIHAADFHLDSPFAALSPERAAQRRGEQRALLDRLADLAIECQAQLVLLSGDLLDSDRTYRETAQTLAQVLGRIPARVFIAPGNHDPYTRDSLYAGMEWPENVHIFTSPVPRGVELPELGCTVYGAAFTAGMAETSPLKGFHAPKGPGEKLMVLHGDVGGTGRYGPISPEDIASSALTYLALGHVHTCSGLCREGGTWWAYPGCPEGRGFDETGEKGVLALQIGEGEVRSAFVPLCRRQYRLLQVDLTGAADPLAAVRAVLPGDTGQDIGRILLTGESALDESGVRRIQTALAPRFWSLEVRGRTRLPRDLWTRQGEDTLAGLFLGEMARRREEGTEEELLDLAVRFGLAALEQGEDVSP